MVIYNPRDWFGLIFQFHKADTFRKLVWVMLSLAVLNGAVVYVYNTYFPDSHNPQPMLHSLLGLVLSLLLVFRTNTAYDRWWEGRKLWGSLVNVSRNFAMKVNAFVPVDQVARREKLSMLGGCYAGILKEHLRNSKREELMKYVPEFFQASIPDPSNHIPNHIANAIQAELLTMFHNKELSEASYLAMLNDLNQFTDICGGCERIKNTPIPYTYNIFIKKFIFIYVITMPFAFEDLGYSSIGITLLVFYAFASLEMIAETIEDPFGKDHDDLPTDNLAATIKGNVREIMETNSGTREKV